MTDRKVRDVFLTYTPYILIVIFSSLIGYVSYVTLKFDLNPVLYLLSAFIQAQSAIIAIVITLTLIAVQLSSSEYSIRLLSVMKRDALFNAIVIIYISSIIYNAMLLSVINKIGSEFVNAGLSISIANFSLSLVMLIPYIYHVLDLLRPESIIIALRKDLSKKYLNSNKHIGKLVEGYRKVDRRDVRPYFRHPSTRGLRISDDDLIPLVDLIKKAIEKDDTYTIMVGIENIAVFHEDLCNKKELSNEEKKYITRLVLRHIRRICRKACQCGDRGAIHDTLRYMNKIVIKSIRFEKEEPIIAALNIFKMAYEEAYHTGRQYGFSGWIWRIGTYMCDLYVKLKAHDIDNSKIMNEIRKFDYFIKNNKLPYSIQYVFDEYEKYLKGIEPENNKEKDKIEKDKKIFAEFRDIYNHRYQ